jgi:hypothetical protein
MAARPRSFLPSGVTGNDAGHFFALYVVARSIPLVLAMGWALTNRSRSLLGFVIGLLGLIQVGDGLIGVHYRSIPQAAVPFAIAIVQFACARWLLQSDGHAVSAHP